MELQEINNIIKDIAQFIQENDTTKQDFNEYMNTVKGSMNQKAAFFSYIFERNINSKSIFNIYLDNNKSITKEAKLIIQSLGKSMSSIFEIKKNLKNGFSLYNVINEKQYDTTSLVKMTTFRGIGIGQYVIARICKYNNKYFLLEISGVLPTTRKDDALRYAIAKIIENPELVYLDNEEKQNEIESDIKQIHQKFVEFFGKDEIITLNKFADNLIGVFNDYAEGGEKTDYSDLVKLPDEYKYFTVKEFNNSYDNFLENSLGGFSSHDEEYDVGIILDEELGMYAIPFYGTFCKIYEINDYTKIVNYDKCVKYFLTNDKFSANLIKRVAKKYKNFEKITNSILGTKLTLDELLNEYKSRYLENKIISSTTVLYRSKAFSNTLGIIEDEENKSHIDVSHKIGRNEPCPCGSGKKYKNCCGAI